VWFNTSCIDEDGDKWMENNTTAYTIEEIKENSRHQTVTHVILRGDNSLDINTMFPHITHLRVNFADSDTNFNRYDTMFSLKVTLSICIKLYNIKSSLGLEARVLA